MQGVPPALTASQRLAGVLLDTDLREWVTERRNPAETRRSWRIIAAELRRETDGAVKVTGETLRGWYRDVDEGDLEDVPA